MYIPVLDNPIDRREIIEAMNACKKGGYDISLPVLDKVISKCLPIFVLLFNFIFYVAYPVKLACSLLFPIPKKGSLKKSSNFRGIQMLPTIGALYDRVITRRLDRWLCIHDEQTGQKGKSTLTQLFTLQIIVEMIKKTGETLYIGCFDIEKAYDKVSRFLLLQKLIKYGIGFAMLNALKAMYTVTTCVICLSGKLSSAFCTYCGIRQGAPSSSGLFMVFVNDLIDFLREHCAIEPIIDNMHALLHADDTLILATNRTLFEKKCNLLIEYFEKNKLKLNIGKSGFMIINGRNTDSKEDIYLKNGKLEYKSEIVYLGLILSDTGNIKTDIKLNLTEKHSNITVKFTNFCSRHFLAPIRVKLDVLHSCVMSSIYYGSETWVDNSFEELEVIYRIGIKTVLSIRPSTRNEITYIEANTYPATYTIKKQQLKFWISFYQNLNHNSSLYKLITKAKEIRLPYIMHYENLLSNYGTPEICERTLKQEFDRDTHDKIHQANTNDPESKLGVYLQVNPELQRPTYDNYLFELERINITRFRTGSHNLLIETGRFNNPKIPRELRICMCGDGIQTLRHVLMDCNLITGAENFERFRNDFSSVHQFFHWPLLHDFLLNISKTLKIDL